MVPFALADLPYFLAMILLLAGSFFFGACETAFFGLSGHQRYRLVHAGGLVGKAVEALLSDQRTLLVTLMVGNMAANVSYFVIGAALLLKLDPAQTHPAWIAALSTVPVVAIIVLGEFLPKLLANAARLPCVRVGAVPLLALHRLAAPASRALARWVVAPLGRLVAPAQEAHLSAQELESLLGLSLKRGVIDSQEQRWLQQVLRLGQLKVRDLMVPRVEIKALDLDKAQRDPARLLEKVRTCRVRGLVACDGNLDHIAGVLEVRRYLLAHRQGRAGDVRALLTPVRFVPELQRTDALLADFCASGTNLAIAVDEYGGTAGLVALKDVVEIMIGDLDTDSGDSGDSEPAAQVLAPGQWRLEGRLNIHDWADYFRGSAIPDRVTTVGGLVTAMLGRAPALGDKLRLGNVELEVQTLRDGRVQSVVMTVLEPQEPTGDGRKNSP